MKRFSEQLQKKAQTIRLSSAEKHELRDRVVSYMEYHPLPVSLKGGKEESFATASGAIRFVHISGWRFLQGAVGVFALMLVSVSYFAERTVPGDTLYAVKVSFNEEIRSTLARSSYEKVVWETERLNRRISEARLLASEGRLTDEVQAEVADAVRSHSDNARREIEILKKTDKDEAALASLQLETTLDIQTQALANDKNIDNEVGTTEGKPSLIANAVSESKQLPGDGNEDEEVLPSYEKLTAHVESETTRAYELLKNIQTTATMAEQADIERRLEDIGRVIEESSKLADSDGVIARQQLVTVLQRTQKLIVFMTNIDVRKSVTVEQIVPVTLTLKERGEAAKAAADEVIKISKELKPILSASTTQPELREKFVPALAQSVATASSTLVLLTQPDVDLANLEGDIKEALATTQDIATVLGFDYKALVAPTEIEGVIIIDTSSTTASSTGATSTEEISADEVIDPLKGDPQPLPQESAI